jgi:hypothetical protein
MSNAEGKDKASPLGLSDDDFLKAAPPVFEPEDEEVSEEDKETPVAEAENKEEDSEEDKDESDESGDSQDEEDESKSDEEEDKDPEVKEDTTKADKKPTDKEVSKDTPEAKPETSAINYEAEYNRILAPFKANGREISVKSVDDAISLMQMGANYNKRMAALKPNLKLMRMLENNGLLDESKINFLIDLEKKNPEAINKLVKDSGIDPMDLTAEKAEAYKQSTYNVDDRELELDTVLDEIKDSPTYNRTLDVVSNKWDGASKQTIASSPQILKLLNSHVESGVYDLISKEMESERVFGRLNGLSDIEAYRQVGDAIQARGGFNHLNQGSSQAQEKPASQAPVVVTPKPKQEDDDKRKDKKRAASSTKPAAPTSKAKEYDPLAMSDEEFLKLAAQQFS